MTAACAAALNLSVLLLTALLKSIDLFQAIKLQTLRWHTVIHYVFLLRQYLMQSYEHSLLW